MTRSALMALDAWRSKARNISVNGANIAFWTSEAIADESLPALLLIHGYPTSSWDWSGLWPALEKRFRLVALDMLGFGLSDKPRTLNYSIMMQADLQEALLADLNIGEAHVFTHDYGNTVGQELLARAQDRTLSFSIKSMAFLNGGLFPEQHRARPIQKLGLTPFGFLLGRLLSRQRLRTTFDEIFGPDTKAPDTEIDGHWDMICENDGAKILHKLLQYIPERQRYRARWVGALKTATMPLRLINGGFDPVSGAHLYHYYKDEVPGADAVLFENIGHYPHTEAPDAVLSAFLEFHNAHKTITSGESSTQ